MLVVRKIMIGRIVHYPTLSPIVLFYAICSEKTELFRNKDRAAALSSIKFSSASVRPDVVV